MSEGSVQQSLSREELKKKLRDKTRKQRQNRVGGGSESSPLAQKNSPQGLANMDFASMMMNMGVEDPMLLQKAKDSNGNPAAMLTLLKDIMSSAELNSISDKADALEEKSVNDDDEEEIPSVIM